MANNSITKQMPQNKLTPRETSLTPAQQNAQTWISDFEKHWTQLAVCRIEDAIAAPLPTLREYTALLGEQKAYAVVTIWLQMILSEVADFFNVGKNFSKTQIAMTTDLIIEHYPHFTLADFKYCFRQNMASGKLFDRLDGNIICGWLNEYDVQRNTLLEKLYEQQDREQYQPPAPVDGTTFEDYTRSVVGRAASGDEEAIDALVKIQEFLDFKKQAGTDYDSRQKKIEFRRRYLTEYYKQKFSDNGKAD